MTGFARSTPELLMFTERIIRPVHDGAGVLQVVLHSEDSYTDPRLVSAMQHLTAALSALGRYVRNDPLTVDDQP